ncbi:hypothetical protein CDAR_123501 [Caerostris darwini]|uniref:Uncharacterized protein n=1 Tax=Caerostris darwini TaxID=1538125 RepID=A0AAV4WWU8_9ARAC|nr:hypothetical protein CDAR_123501 [Caerostris darwini]
MCTDYLMRFTVTKALPLADTTEIAKYIVEEVILKHGNDDDSKDMINNRRAGACVIFLANIRLLLPVFIVVYLILNCKNFSLHLLKLEQNGAKQQVKKSKASCESSIS